MTVSFAARTPGGAASHVGQLQRGRAVRLVLEAGVSARGCRSQVMRAVQRCRLMHIRSSATASLAWPLPDTRCAQRLFRHDKLATLRKHGPACLRARLRTACARAMVNVHRLVISLRKLASGIAK